MEYFFENFNILGSGAVNDNKNGIQYKIIIIFIFMFGLSIYKTRQV